MANEALVAAIKDIMGLAKAGKADEAYAAYAQLFSSPAFAEYRPEDQRQALKLMVLAKGIPFPPTPAIVSAHKAASVPCQGLVDSLKDPQDYELLGMCQVKMGDEAAAAVAFKTGLDIERERDPQSKLCGTLMKLVASV